jgi:TonB family protein
VKTFLLFLMLVAIARPQTIEQTERTVHSMEVPQYPALALQARVQGVVEMIVNVSATGEVTNATVDTGHPLLNALSVENIKTWRFVPASDGKSSRLHITYSYKLDDSLHPHRRLNIDLPTRVEIISPALPVFTNTSSIQAR